MTFKKREIAIIKGMIARGDKQHDIAAYFGVNGGRIAEINTGHNEHALAIEPAAESELPPAGPIMSGRSAQRALATLHALRELIDEAIADVEAFERGDK